ncbi:PREDICTED: glutathione S-transferase T3-like [Brassica oleracea var. oleracea]|uniref:glutathione S-transferase T3-like n=1 Tax=Brassica oleracea var. oleracea TaxID=109376 RepID=UPI0006A6F49F|nr:PREDICTED: glutathione S-transferase T3-like [Brassica oleracea var. oleracea]
MDPRNLHTQSSSYVGLLHKIPAFSSQQSEDASVDTPVERLVIRKWTPADDEVLISVWLNSSKDVIVGNEQKSGTFWKRVGDNYAASPHGGEDGEKREHLHCKKRWQRINDQVNKFCAAYSAAERQISSGIIHLYGDEYLRHPTPDDLQRLLYIGEQRGFPRLVESIDCMH